jgi:hypothetical protein
MFQCNALEVNCKLVTSGTELAWLLCVPGSLVVAELTGYYLARRVFAHGVGKRQCKTMEVDCKLVTSRTELACL